MRISFLAALGAIQLFAAAGCSDSDPVTTPNPSDPSEESQGIPTLSEVQARVTLTPDQAMEVNAALQEWERESLTWMGTEDVLLEDSPAIAFLARTSAVLTPVQQAALRVLVGQRVGGRALFLLPDPGDRRGYEYPGVRGLFRQLELTSEQVAALREALATARDEAGALCQQYRSGQITLDEFLTGRAEIRAALAAAIAEILDDTQDAQFEQNKVDILLRRLEVMLLNFDVRVEQRVAQLDALVDLSAEQEVAITTALQAARPELEALGQDLEAGNLTSAEGWDAFRTIQMSTYEAVRAELTSEQLAMLDELRLMHEPCRTGIEV